MEGDGGIIFAFVFSTIEDKKKNKKCLIDFSNNKKDKTKNRE